MKLTDENFNTVINSTPAILVDFWATWCGPCKMMNPVLEELATDSTCRAVIAKADADESPEAMTKYNVKSVPTFILFKYGQEVSRVTGAQSKTSLLNLINN